jgi:hypothetical protein
MRAGALRVGDAAIAEDDPVAMTTGRPRSAERDGAMDDR